MNKKKATRFLKLPFQFEEKSLVRDLNHLIDGKWHLHFNQNGYEGQWSVIVLHAENGDESHIYARPTVLSPLKETPIMEDCPYFREVISHFKCPLLSVRLLKLGAGSVIKPHRDHELGYEDGNFRLHIPITTNPQVTFVLDNEKLPMKPGDCWYTNVNYVHSVSNLGEMDRVHLVIDGERNEWTDELFFSLAPRESFFPIKEESLSPETLQRMIEELNQMDNPWNQPLIANLQQQLKSHSSKNPVNKIIK